MLPSIYRADESNIKHLTYNENEKKTGVVHYKGVSLNVIKFAASSTVSFLFFLVTIVKSIAIKILSIVSGYSDGNRLNDRGFSVILKPGWRKIASFIVFLGFFCLFFNKKNVDNHKTHELDKIKEEKDKYHNLWFDRKIKEHPCNIKVNSHGYNIDGYCTPEEKENAQKEFERLFNEKVQTDKKSIEDHEKSIEDYKKSMKDREKEREAFEKKMDEWWESAKTPPEEIERMMREAREETDKFFQGWLPGYVLRGGEGDSPPLERPGCPANVAKINPKEYAQRSHLELALDTKINAFCKEHAELILRVNSQSTESAVRKQFRQLSLLYHPDKNPDENSKKVFNMIRNAYETLTL